jgi:hypothetical protein
MHIITSHTEIMTAPAKRQEAGATSSKQELLSRVTKLSLDNM